MAEDPLQIQPARGPGRPFEKGQSSNPAGKPPGCENHMTRAAEMLFDGEAKALTRKAVALALDGDPTAMRLCLERIVAPRRARTLQLDLPPIADPADIAAAMTAITNAVAEGAITPGEAAEVAKVVDTLVRAIEASDFDRWLKLLVASHAADA
jgi:hypothetical protein